MKYISHYLKHISNSNHYCHYRIQVGEHLLSLVQELEAFASSDALPDLWRLTSEAQTQSLLSSLSARGWRQLRVALDIKEEEGTERMCCRSTCATAVVAAEKAMFGTQLSKVTEEHSSAENADQIGGMTFLCNLYSN